MIGHMTGQMGGASHNPTEDPWEKRRDDGRRRANHLQTIDGLYTLSRRGLWRLILFLATSAAFLRCRNFDLFAALPENVREILGAPPPLALIHAMLAVSGVSALILIAGGGAGNERRCNGWMQFGMLLFYYPLYASANVLEAYFPVVFVTGLFILSLEHFTTWSQANREIREEMERLGRIC